MPAIAPTDDTMTLSVPPLELAFHWDGARWSHALTVAGRRVAVTIEGDPARDEASRIISPVYQQFHLHEHDGQPAALLVGQWGTHHTSAAFLVADAGILVDVAVRSRDPLAALASTYLVDLSSSELETADPAAIVWRLPAEPPGRLRFEALTPEGGEPVRADLCEAGRRSVRVQASLVPRPGPATRRLRYRWSWLPDRPASIPTPRAEASRHEPSA